MKILIQKFGGTSVSTKERRDFVCNKIKNAIEEGYSPVVVVSAMGRKGEPYATDTLLSLIEKKFKNHNPMAADLLLCCGEIISSVVMCNELYDLGIKAQPLTGGQAGIITDDNFNDADVLKVEVKKMEKLLKQGIIPIVTGFQGVTEEGDFTTLGRGGSDFSASILGAALKAEEIHIFKDVDGIMTADPRIVDDAYIIDTISYNEVFQLADQGAKVIHPRAVEAAMRGNIPLVIKNTMSDAKGTLINNFGDKSNSNIITGITHMSGRIQINVYLSENIDNDNFYSLFDVLAENFISIDLINVFQNQRTFTIDEECVEKLDDIMSNLNLKYSYIDKCSKISVIGSKIRGVPGVMAKILKALSKEKIEVLQTADSHTTIWCLIPTEHVDVAIKTIHKIFMTNS